MCPAPDCDGGKQSGPYSIAEGRASSDLRCYWWWVCSNYSYSNFRDQQLNNILSHEKSLRSNNMDGAKRDFEKKKKKVQWTQLAVKWPSANCQYGTTETACHIVMNFSLENNRWKMNLNRSFLLILLSLMIFLELRYLVRSIMEETAAITEKNL